MPGCLDENQVVDFLQGTNVPAEGESFERHIEGCDACRELLATMATVLDTPLREGATRARMPSQFPAVEGRYEMLHVIGKGGVGVVWEAQDLAVDRRVAVKIVRCDNPTLRRRTLREARVGSVLSHPAVLAVEECFETLDGDLALVMELLTGEDLAAHLARVGRLSPEGASTILAPVASALTAAHAVGLVHRDIKPHNVYLASNGVRLLDFGMTKLMSELGLASTAGTLTASNMVLGTPHYMAPEQLFGEASVGPAADVWALGVVLYECVSAARPVDGKSFGQIFRAVADGNIHPLRDVAPEVPEPFAALVMRMLQLEPAARPAAAEVHAALAAWANPSADTTTTLG